MNEKKVKKLRGKYPWKWTIKRIATKDAKAKTAFKRHPIFEVIYTAFLLRIPTTTISIAKELSENYYREIEKANAAIRKIKALYEKDAIHVARRMTNAKQPNQAGRHAQAYQALYAQARNAYEALRAETKVKIGGELDKIKLLQTEIELCIDREMAYASELIVIYWQAAKRIYTVLDPDPPQIDVLIKIAEIGMPEVLSEDANLPDIDEYLRHESVSSLPRSYVSQPQLMVANVPPAQVTANPYNQICPQCSAEPLPNSKFCSECGHKF